MHVVSPFIGGAFGSKGPADASAPPWSPGSRRASSTVRSSSCMTRAQGFTIALVQSGDEVIRVKLGAPPPRARSTALMRMTAWEITSRLRRFRGSAGTGSLDVHLYGMPQYRQHQGPSSNGPTGATPGYMRSAARGAVHVRAGKCDGRACRARSPWTRSNCAALNDTMKQPGHRGCPTTSRVADALLRSRPPRRSAGRSAIPRPGAMSRGRLG